MTYIVAKGLKIRMLTVLAVFGICVCAILARAFQIQVLQAPKLKDLANRQHHHTLEIQATRGDILDAEGEPLAVSREQAQVYARPEDLEDAAAAAQMLAPILNLTPAELAKKLSSKANFVWLSRGASLEQAEAIKRLDVAGIGLLPATRRFYPGADSAAHLLGFTGLDNQGLEGIEHQYDQLLKGSTVRIWLERDARGKAVFMSDQLEGLDPLAGDSGRASKYSALFRDDARGAHVKLTILRPLQYLAESELEAGIQKAGAKAGCVLAMEPDTGKILAMASYPKFDPNNFRDYEQQNYRNRCVVWNYEPGSTFKPFTISGGIEDGLITPTDTFNCENGSFVYGGSTIRDISKYGTLTVEQIIMNSSNIGAAKIGDKMGKERMYRTYAAFGFGAKTGLDFPGESAGMLMHYKKWSQVSVATFAFGQGVAVTPLQMLTGLCAIANGGMLMKPYVAETAIMPDGTEKMLNSPTPLRRVISPDTAREVSAILTKVVSEHATGKNAQVPGYSAAGKTGTAQKASESQRGYEDGKYVVSFMGFLPTGRPRLAIIVCLDEPTEGVLFGGVLAAPVFKAIAQKAMVLLKVPPENEQQRLALPEPPKSPKLAKMEPGAETKSRIEYWKKLREWDTRKNAPAGDGQVRVPELRGLSLRQALRALGGLTVAVEVEGSGVVANVTPAAGTVVPEQSVIHLGLENVP
jgi:cell division protein FtsI (penicillin-binding protein 3)